LYSILIVLSVSSAFGQLENKDLDKEIEQRTGSQDTSSAKNGKSNSTDLPFKYSSEGTLTYSTFFSDEVLLKHSYFWNTTALDLNFTSDYHLASDIKIFKYSFSYPLTQEPFNFRIFPWIYFEGSSSGLISEKSAGKDRLRLDAGYIQDFTPGNGLIYSQVTALGTKGLWIIPYGEIESQIIGSGYYAGDDVFVLFYYLPQRKLGAGFYVENDAPFGDRLVHSLTFESEFEFVKFYGEGGITYLFNPFLNTRFENNYYYRYQQDTIASDDLNKFSKNYTINSGSKVKEWTNLSPKGASFST